MNPIIKADVLAIASELSVLSDQAWVDILTWVNEFDFTSLDTEQTVRMARIFLAAHLGTRAKRAGSTGAVGPVISEAAGGVRRAYGQVSTTGTINELGSSTYGMMLTTILSMSGAHGPFVV